LDAESGKSWLSYIFDLSEHNPDKVCMLSGALLGWIIVLVLERFVLPTVQDPAAKRRQQAFTFFACWLLGAISSATMWWAWDDADPLKARVVASVVSTGILSFLYPIGAGYLTTKYPALGSAWAKVEGENKEGK